MKRHLLLFSASLCLACWLGFQGGKLFSSDGQPIASSRTQPSSPQSQVSGSFDEPIIGIASLTDESYVRAIRDLGGIPVVLPNTDGSTAMIDEYLELLDGLLMPGGADIPPAEYGEAPHPTTKVLDEDRYRFEKALISAWIQQTDKPLLGICLGSQWVNVAMGGSLIQDIPSEFGVQHRGTTHSVQLSRDSRLAQIFGVTEFDVNSFHHQAVRNLGDDLRIVARSEDGIVEATETTNPDRFLIGVQWHPEKMILHEELQSRLFKAFLKASSSFKGRALVNAAKDEVLSLN